VWLEADTPAGEAQRHRCRRVRQAGFGEIQILDFGRFLSPESGSGNPESGIPDLEIWMSLDFGGGAGGGVQ
jgi:hypothetical protein